MGVISLFKLKIYVSFLWGIGGYHKFLPDHKNLTIFPGRKRLKFRKLLEYLRDLGGFAKLTIFLQLVDISTDILFANEIFKESACVLFNSDFRWFSFSNEAGSLAAASTVLATIVTALMWEVSQKRFSNEIISWWARCCKLEIWNQTGWEGHI